MLTAKHVPWLGVLAALLLLSDSSQATLLPVTLPDSRQGVLDTSTNLSWLRLQYTGYRSYQNVSSRLGVGAEFHGYRYAAVMEVATLFDHAGLALGELTFDHVGSEKYREFILLLHPTAYQYWPSPVYPRVGNYASALAIAMDPSGSGILHLPYVHWETDGCTYSDGSVIASGYAALDPASFSGWGANISVNTAASWLVRPPPPARCSTRECGLCRGTLAAQFRQHNPTSGNSPQTTGRGLMYCRLLYVVGEC